LNGLAGRGRRLGRLRLIGRLRVGLGLAGFAGFTLAAALPALYLWQGRELKHRSATLLRLRAPSLVTLDSLAARTVAFALPVLTLGMAAGFARIRHGSDLDPLIVFTLLTGTGYGAVLVLRYGAGWMPQHMHWGVYGMSAGVLLLMSRDLAQRFDFNPSGPGWRLNRWRELPRSFWRVSTVLGWLLGILGHFLLRGWQPAGAAAPMWPLIASRRCVP